jgi:DNA-binding NarL/FixJ family response regulator
MAVGTVRSTEHALSALAAAVGGAGLIVTARGTMLERLIEDLQDLCAGRKQRLSYEERRLLKLLAAGISVSEAARKLYISRRTAERRLRAARLTLGVRTTTEAVMAVGRSQRGRLLHIVRAS